jgi:hypothetical protein
MKRQSVVAGLVLATAALVGAADRAREEGALREWIPLDHPKLVELLRTIDVKDPYTVPPLEVRKDENYAGTAVDVEPFGGVRPFNEFFLKQMEYTGPGRASPSSSGTSAAATSSGRSPSISSSATTTGCGEPPGTRSSSRTTRTGSGRSWGRSTGPTATSPSGWRSSPRS